MALTVDGEPSATVELWEELQSRGNFYFGGWSFLSSVSDGISLVPKLTCHLFPGCPGKDCQVPPPTFQGCMRLLFINSQPVDLGHVQQRFLGNYNELQFDSCNIRDR